MKAYLNTQKLLLAALVLLGFFSVKSNAQSNLELGLRLADNISIDATVPLAAAPRLHPAIYFDRFGLATYFDWMFSLQGGPTGLKFYPGVGPEVWLGDSVDFDIAGNFGAEYSFEFPLTIAFDWRPAFRVTDEFRFRSGNWGVSARFRFGESVRFRRESYLRRRNRQLARK